MHSRPCFVDWALEHLIVLYCIVWSGRDHRGADLPRPDAEAVFLRHLDRPQCKDLHRYRIFADAGRPGPWVGRIPVGDVRPGRGGGPLRTVVRCRALLLLRAARRADRQRHWPLCGPLVPFWRHPGGSGRLWKRPVAVLARHRIRARLPEGGRRGLRSARWIFGRSPLHGYLRDRVDDDNARYLQVGFFNDRFSPIEICVAVYMVTSFL